MREDVQHESSTSSVQAVMAVQIRHIISTHEDVTHVQASKSSSFGLGEGHYLRIPSNE